MEPGVSSVWAPHPGPRALRPLAFPVRCDLLCWVPSTSQSLHSGQSRGKGGHPTRASYTEVASTSMGGPAAGASGVGAARVHMTSRSEPGAFSHHAVGVSSEPWWPAMRPPLSVEYWPFGRPARMWHPALGVRGLFAAARRLREAPRPATRCRQLPFLGRVLLSRSCFDASSHLLGSSQDKQLPRGWPSCVHATGRGGLDRVDVSANRRSCLGPEPSLRSRLQVPQLHTDLHARPRQTTGPQWPSRGPESSRVPLPGRGSGLCVP